MQLGTVPSEKKCASAAKSKEQKMSGKFLLLLIVCLSICQANNSSNKTSKKCKKCPPGWGVSKKCTKDTNTECTKCTPGRTYSPHRSLKSPCWLCSQCGVGLFESHGCSPVRDTICSECVTYLDPLDEHSGFDEGEFVITTNDVNAPTGLVFETECKGQSLR